MFSVVKRHSKQWWHCCTTLSGCALFIVYRIGYHFSGYYLTLLISLYLKCVCYCHHAPFLCYFIRVNGVSISRFAVNQVVNALGIYFSHYEREPLAIKLAALTLAGAYVCIFHVEEIQQEQEFIRLMITLAKSPDTIFAVTFIAICFTVYCCCMVFCGLNFSCFGSLLSRKKKSKKKTMKRVNKKDIEAKRSKKSESGTKKKQTNFCNFLTDSIAYHLVCAHICMVLSHLLSLAIKVKFEYYKNNKSEQVLPSLYQLKISVVVSTVRQWISAIMFDRFEFYFHKKLKMIGSQPKAVTLLKLIIMIGVRFLAIISSTIVYYNIKKNSIEQSNYCNTTNTLHS